MPHRAGPAHVIQGEIIVVRTRKKLVAGVAAAAVSAALIAIPTVAQAGGGRSDRLTVVGLTDTNRLVTFSTDRPGRIRNRGTVDGLSGDTRLVGIDYRVQNNRLYGVGNAGGVYTINVAQSRAAKVGQLTVALNGTSFGVDFNPAANRLRVISDTGQNLRHNIDDPAGLPAAGTTANDATLTYPAAGATPAATGTGITGAAYTNNDLNATTATTLFDVDTNLDQVVVQSPANAGLLAATGKLGVNASSAAGFDIYSTTEKGVTVRNRAFAALTVDGRAGLYEVDLLTGDADLVGRFASKRQVVDIALPTGQKKR